MRLRITKCKNTEIFYVIKTVYVDGKQLNKQEKEGTRDILIKKSQVTQIEKNQDSCFNCGYLFLEKIYYELGIDNICEEITNKYQFKYDLNNILSRLIYGRIIFPSSKLATKAYPFPKFH